MKKLFICFIIFFINFSSKAQTAITAVTTTTTAAASTYSYTAAPNTYNWGTGSEVSIDGFTTGGLPYTYASFLNGVVKIRRVDNTVAGRTPVTIAGNYTLVWAQGTTAATPFNISNAYQNDMESFFDSRTINKGTDNFLDNVSANSNNVERLDWILSAGYSTANVSKVGFCVFERGNPAAHDSFCIATILTLDGLGNPATYGPILRVPTSAYGATDATGAGNVQYRVLKAQNPTDLLDAGGNTQSRGGVFITFQDMGIASGTTIYGYSLFATDFPIGGTPAMLVDYTNATNFPINTSTALGGIDLIAITGISIANSVLPVKFTGFNAVENNGNISLQWAVQNEVDVTSYTIERSFDGIHFIEIKEVVSSKNTVSSAIYKTIDNVTGISTSAIYYRIKQYDANGAFSYSKTIAVKRNNKTNTLALYPNPTTNNLFINIPNNNNEKAFITIVNAAGAQVSQQQIQLASGNNSFTIDNIEQVSKGNYQLIIKWSSGKTIIKQFVKQ